MSRVSPPRKKKKIQKQALLRATTSVCANFLSILQGKPTFSILYTCFYKTPTSICLFYYLFYLNNYFSHFYYFISNTLSPLTRLSLFPSETLIQAWRETLLFETPIQAPILADPSTDTCQSTSANPPQASIGHKRRSAISADLQASIHSLCLYWCVHVWVCLVFWCLWLILLLILWLFFIFVVDF